MVAKKKELSRTELGEVFSYATQVYRAIKKNPDFVNTFYNTQSSHEVLSMLDGSPMNIDEETIEKALSRPSENEKILKTVSSFMYTYDSIFANTSNYYSSLLNFDIYSYCENATKEDYDSIDYKNDEKRFERFLNSFDKHELRTAFQNVLLYDTYFTWLRDTINTLDNEGNLKTSKADVSTLQTMPQSRCILTSKTNLGYSYDFDINYFSQTGVNMLDYDSSLIEAYNNIDKHTSSENYPQAIITDRGSQTLGFANYVRADVSKGAWVWKFNDFTANTILPLGHMLLNCLDNDEVRKLQKNKDLIASTAYIIGEIKTNKQVTSADKKNPFIINGADLITFMSLVKKGLSKTVKPLAMPTENNQWVQPVDSNPSMQSHQLRGSAGLGASASRLIYADTDLGQAEVENALTMDYNYVSKAFYPQCEAFLTYFGNKLTKKYKFKVRVTGSTLPHLRSKDFELQSKLATMGLQCSVGRWGALLGLENGELRAMMTEFKAKNTIDDLVLLLNANTSKDGGKLSDTNGRPDRERTEVNRIDDKGEG